MHVGSCRGRRQSDSTTWIGRGEIKREREREREMLNIRLRYEGCKVQTKNVTVYRYKGNDVSMDTKDLQARRYSIANCGSQ